MEAALNGPFGRTPLGAGALKIGRAPDNTLVINDPQSSAHHAEVAPGYGGSGYQITDLHSTNGTFINEQRLAPNTPRPLNNSDVIRIGALTFTYEASSGYAPTVVASSGGYAPTIAANSINSDQTVADPPQVAYNAAPPPPAFTPTPPQPPVYQPPVYPQPQPASFNQSAYPLPQPGFGQSYPPKKKSRAGLWVTLIILLLLVVGGGIGGYLYLQNRSTPEKTLQAYCTALQNNDAQGIYNAYSSEAESHTTVDKISQGLQLIKFLLGGITNCTYSSVTVKDNNATAILTLTPQRGKIASGPVALVYENSQWKMSSNKLLQGI